MTNAKVILVAAMINAKIILVLSVSASVIACSHPTQNDEGVSLLGTEWHLRAFVSGNGEVSSVGSQGIVLTFLSDSLFGGYAFRISGPEVGGNHYQGAYEASLDGRIVVDWIGGTKIGLPPGSRYGEYVHAMDSSVAFVIRGNKLRIFYDSAKTSLLFDRVRDSGGP